MRRLLLLCGLAAALTSCTALRVVTHSVNTDPVKAPAGQYQLDPHHWDVSFDVEHLGFARFVMRFNQVTASLDFDPAVPEKSSVQAVLKAGSIDSKDKALDALVTRDLLEAEKFPDILFQATALVRTGPASGTMTGNLTIKNVTHPVTLQVNFNGSAPNPLTGAHTLGFSAEGTFDRAQWGLGKWYPAVGNDVRMRIEAEFVKAES